MKLISELSTYNADEMMGNWIGRGVDFTIDSRTGEYAGFDRDMISYDAKILLTVWASSPITNYAARQFDGLMDDYFYKMWKRLLDRVGLALQKKEEAPERLGEECFRIGWEFVLSDKAYRREPADPDGEGQDRGLAKIWRDVQKHLGTGAECSALCARLDRVIERKKNAGRSEAEVSEAVAATLEKK